MRQIGIGLQQYLTDYDSRYPQEHPSCPNPAIGTGSTVPPGDYDASLEATDFGSPFDKILPYIGAGSSSGNVGIYVCPSDIDPHGLKVLDSNGNCLGSTPPPGPLSSYLVNAYFLFGLAEPQMADPTGVIYIVERNSAFCDVHVHPWLGEIYDAPGAVGAINGNSPYPSYIGNPDGFYAIAGNRHTDGANYVFADGHVKWENYAATVLATADQPFLGQYQALPGQPGATP